jgi:hypothetical protein
VAQITFKGKAIQTSGDLVVDEKGVVIHTELVHDIGQEPDYDGVEAVLK